MIPHVSTPARCRLCGESIGPDGWTASDWFGGSWPCIGSVHDPIPEDSVAGPPNDGEEDEERRPGAR
jgi:hypothetical protein